MAICFDENVAWLDVPVEDEFFMEKSYGSALNTVSASDQVCSKIKETYDLCSVNPGGWGRKVAIDSEQAF